MAILRHADNYEGNDIKSGDINFRYLPPFAFLMSPDGRIYKDPNFGHRIGVLIFGQFHRRVKWYKEDEWCNAKGVFGRLRVILTQL